MNNMGNTLNIIYKGFSKQNEFIQDVLKKGNVYVALSIGFFSIFFYSMFERVSDFSEHKLSLIQIGRIITIELISSGVFLIVSIALTYSIVRTFRGKKDFKLFLIAKGWGGIFGIVFTVLLLPIYVGHFIKLGPLFSLVTALPIGASVLASLVVLFYLIKYEVLIIRSLFNFSIVKALLIWIVALVPSILVYQSFSLLIDRERRTEMLKVYEHLNKKNLNADYKTEKND
jgi:hypothetical protein